MRADSITVAQREEISDIIDFHEKVVRHLKGEKVTFTEIERKKAMICPNCKVLFHEYEGRTVKDD